MACNYNPQGFATMSTNNIPATTTYTSDSNNNMLNNVYPPSTDSGYASVNQWGEPVVVNPTDPTSPLSVQPNGSSTPFVVEAQANIAPLPETLTQSIYTPGYLNNYIGRLMRVEFLIGSQTTDRVGYLREVGASYIVLESVDYGNLMMCDLYSIKFATILRHQLDASVATLYEEQ